MRIRRCGLTLVLAVTVAVSASAQQPARHTITHDDLYAMKRIGAPALSPDGGSIVLQEWMDGVLARLAVGLTTCDICRQ